MKNKIDIKKIIITLVSVVFMGISVSVLNLVDWGMDPFTYMNVSISNKFGWSLGNWQLLLNVLMFIPVIIWGRKQIGIGTVFNMVLVGYIVDLCMWLWGKLGVITYLENIVIKIIVMLVALIIFIYSAATYMATDLGTAPFDALPIIVSDRVKKVPFKVIRFTWDLSATVIGFVFSGRVGIVTVLMVLFLGRTVEAVREKMR